MPGKGMKTRDTRAGKVNLERLDSCIEGALRLLVQINLARAEFWEIEFSRGY